MNLQTIQIAFERGILDETTIQEQIKIMEDKIYLSQHKFKIWLDKTGRWTTYLPSDNGRKLIKKSRKEDLETVVIEYYKSQDPKNQFKGLFEAWIARKLDRMEIQEPTVDKYRATFRRYIEPSVLNNMEFEEITVDILDTFVINVIKSNNLTAKGWADIRLILRGVWKYAYKRGKTNLRIEDFFNELDLSPKIFKRRSIEDDEQVFNDREIEKLRDYIYSEDEIKAVDLGILLAMETGLRAGELIGLKFSDYNEKTGVLTVTRTEIRSRGEKGHTNYQMRDCTKGKVGYRQIVLLDEAVDIINRLKELPDTNGEYIFKGDNDRHCTVFTNRLYRICDNLNIKRKSLHKCRKTYATKLLDGHVPDSLIMSQMGHTDITTTKMHYYYNRRNVDEERKKLVECLCGI